MSDYITGECGCVIGIFNNGEVDLFRACTKHKCMIATHALKNPTNDPRLA